MRPDSPSPVIPFLIACAGIATFSAMDVLMKGLSIDIGAYNAVLWRTGAGTILSGALYFASRPAMPNRATLRIHAVRSLFVAGMAVSFFWALARLPMAEAIAIAFIAPLVALYMAAIFLGERIGPRSILASLLGLAGVIVIVGGKLGRGDYAPEALWAVAAVVGSALLYAYNLILARRQAKMAEPMEIAFFQNGFVALILALGAPWWLAVPGGEQALPIIGAAMLAVTSLLLLSWAYARAETQILATTEYSGFLWAILFGWMFFAEAVTWPTIAGAVLIVLGCLIVARKVPHDDPVEPAAA
ncbi:MULTISPECIES: DMT family transporter [unclassified Sphingopyxis]|jgi:drug/metabolite transporter (DMT)-like permease|uniref:DMT family transporter n=1 Tax=unclassified Sphingopyxis TaxID=2614943 RepID=UPI00285A008F|nr:MULTISPECIES: DMT family transporter [unclassified Sphingopyxis]MDR6832688.1 S-adenosylmethionine uptake transporter [Sphingopyxis sp. BE122]MDR7228431.1 S-adenosylmethionine uptake transporter [Sphingopyxis sp. BE259]